MVASLLRELFGRGYPDLAERLLRNVESLRAGHTDVADLAMLAEIGRACRMPHLRLAILGAISDSWQHSELTMLLNRETARWLIAAFLEAIPDDLPADRRDVVLSQARTVESAGQLWRNAKIHHLLRTAEEACDSDGCLRHDLQAWGSATSSCYPEAAASSSQ